VFSHFAFPHNMKMVILPRQARDKLNIRNAQGVSPGLRLRAVHTSSLQQTRQPVDLVLSVLVVDCSDSVLRALYRGRLS